MKIILKGQVRGGKNNMGITMTGRHYPNKKFATWRDDALLQVQAQIIGKELPIISVPCLVHIDYYAGDKRRRDVPAILDAIWHVLEKAQVVKDDCLLCNIVFKTYYNKENPEVIIDFK